MNPADGLRINSWRFPDKDAVVFEDKRCTYEEHNERSNMLAHAMKERGFGIGDKVAILLYNCIEFLEIYHGLARIGTISVPINFRLVAGEWNYIIDNSDSTALILSPEFIKDLDLNALPQLKKENIIVVGSKEDTPEGMSNYEEMVTGMPTSEPTDATPEDEIFYFGYTSGTTGRPKAGMIPYRSTLETVKNALVRNARRKGIKMEDRTFLGIMPVCHSNTIWATLITYWMGGTNVIFPSGRFDPEKVLQVIDKEKVTTTSMVPTMITRILELPEEVKSKYNMSSLASMGSSSAPLHTTTKEEALEFFGNVRISEGYGATEMGAVTTLRHRDQKRKVRSIGKPNPGVEVRLTDEDGNVIAEPHKQGILWAKTPSAFVGYYKDPEKTAESIDGEWVSAGDVAYFDEEGYYFLVDRKHDMIISGGENIYPAETEEVIMSHPKVSEVAVIGVPNPDFGEEVKAVVIPKEGEKITEQEIIEYCKDKLAGYKRPRSVDFVDDFPRTATGKILKRIIKEKYWKGHERMI